MTVSAQIPSAAAAADAPLAPEQRTRTIEWVGPFAVFMAWLALDKYLPIENPVKEVVRDVVILAAILGFSRRLLRGYAMRAPHWIGSVVLGVAVCALWVLPDVLIPGWRGHWLFQNDITGRITTSIPPGELTPLMLALRTMRAALLVPILEELFWRGWLPRWLQNTDVDRVRLGQYTTFAFVATALLFGAEHGPFWEVGILAGLAYNWWMRRTRSLGDLILAHSVTNLALSLYVIGTRDWRFWM